MSLAVWGALRSAAAPISVNTISGSTQLSKEKVVSAEIYPDLAGGDEESETLVQIADILPSSSLIWLDSSDMYKEQAFYPLLERFFCFKVLCKPVSPYAPLTCIKYEQPLLSALRRIIFLSCPFFFPFTYIILLGKMQPFLIV